MPIDTLSSENTNLTYVGSMYLQHINITRPINLMIFIIELWYGDASLEVARIRLQGAVVLIHVSRQDDLNDSQYK